MIHSERHVEIRSDPVLIEPGESACETINGAGASRIVLVCEHACNFIPPSLDGLGLSREVQNSHAAWDPGALGVARELSRILDAPLVASNISRLVYDCNRPPETPSAMPARSEIYDIPGNTNLNADSVRQRFEQVYLPFRDMLASVISDRMQSGNKPIVVTVHSFTPVYYGKQRDVEIGILHGTDPRLADAMLADKGRFGRFRVRRNEPYGPADGVAHTIDEHGNSNGLLNVMIEIRNDLIGTETSQAELARLLAGMLEGAFLQLDQRLQIPTLLQEEVPCPE